MSNNLALAATMGGLRVPVLVAMAAGLAAVAAFVVVGLPAADADPCGPSVLSTCYDAAGNAFSDGSVQRYRWIDQTDISPKPKPGPTNTGYVWTEISTLVPQVTGPNPPPPPPPAPPPPSSPTIPRQGYSGDCIRMRGSLADPAMQFTYYGQTYDCVWIAANGFVILDNYATKTNPDGDGCPPYPAPTPPGAYCEVPARLNQATQAPAPAFQVTAAQATVGPNRPFVAGFWVQDAEPTQCYNPPAGNGGIYATAVGPIGDRRFIVEYNGILVYAADTASAQCGPPFTSCQMPPHLTCYWMTFQIVFYEKSPTAGLADTIDVMLRKAITPDAKPDQSPIPNFAAMGIRSGPGACAGWAASGMCALTYQYSPDLNYDLHSVRYYPNHLPAVGTSTIDEDFGAQTVNLALLCNNSPVVACDVDGDQLTCQVTTMPPAPKGQLVPGLSTPNTACVRTFEPTQDLCTEYGAFNPITFPQVVNDRVLRGDSAPTSQPLNMQASIRINCINDRPAVGSGSGDVTGVVGTPVTYNDWATGVFPGPFTAVDEDPQAITFLLVSPPPPGAFTVQPTLTRYPSATTGQVASLTFTGSAPGIYEDICWRAVDNGGLAPASPPAFDTSLETVCLDITIINSGGNGGGTGSCGTLTPAFTITGNQLTDGNPITFTDHSTASGSTITGWSWEFGDGYTATVASTTHTYTQLGDYPVRLLIVDDGGCAATTSYVLRIGPPGPGDDTGGAFDPGYPPPVVDAGEDRAVVEGQRVQLEAKVTNAATATITYTWRQVSGPAATLLKGETAAPELIAPKLADPQTPAKMVFAVRVSDGKAESPEDMVTITIAAHNQRPPVANAGQDITATKGDSVALSAAASSDPDGDAIAYAWGQLAGPRIQSLPASGPQILVLTPADTNATFIDVQLKVTDGTYTTSDSVRIWLRSAGEIALSFQATSLRNGAVLFTAHGPAEEYVWDFGDGMTETTRAPTVTHVYQVSGPYTVNLRAGADGVPWTQEVHATVARGVPEAVDDGGTPGWLLTVGLALAVLGVIAVAAMLAYTLKTTRRP